MARMEGEQRIGLRQEKGRGGGVELFTARDWERLTLQW